MSSFDGLPDFGAPVTGGPGPIFAVYGGAPVFAALPDTVAVATAPNGDPQFRIDLLQPQVPSAALRAGGSLQLGIAVACQLAACVAAVRAAHPYAQVAAAQPAGGYLRFLSATAKVTIPPSLAGPHYLDWTSMQSVRLALSDLATDAITLLEGALLSTAMLVIARLELDVAGVAPRLAGTAVCSPKQILAPLLPASRRIAYDAFTAAFLRPRALGVQLTGAAATVDDAHLAAAIADRIRAGWATLVASDDGQTPTLQFAADLPDSAQWDLSQPTAARRPVALALDPLAAPRALAAKGGLDRLIIKELVPPLPTGVWRVDVAANLPDARAGALMAGATLHAPPTPHRARAIDQTVELGANDTANTQLHLSPADMLAYTATPFIVVPGGGSVRQLSGAAIASTAAFLQLAQADFPVAWLPVTAHPDLLAEATVTGALDVADPAAPGGVTPIAIQLTAAAPTANVAVPIGATATWRLTATSGGASIALPPQPAVPGGPALAIGGWSVPGYGTHAVEIRATFPPGAPAFGLDLADELHTGDPQTILVAPGTPIAWSYFAASAFHAGYRYRLNGTQAWLAGPGAVLAITAPPLALPAPFEVEHVHCYCELGAAGDAATARLIVRYLPPAPAPQRDADGKAELSLLGGFLTVAARYDLDPTLFDMIRAEVGAQYPLLAAADWQPAPVTVTQISASLVAAAGAAPTALCAATALGDGPWTAALHAQLTDAQAARAKLALAGQAGILTVTVAATPAPALTATLADHPATLNFTADVATWVAPGDQNSIDAQGGTT